ncbi:hypothetical protein pb186bvf_019794 [Paramecium bursaria]
MKYKKVYQQYENTLKQNICLLLAHPYLESSRLKKKNKKIIVFIFVVINLIKLKFMRLMRTKAKDILLIQKKEFSNSHFSQYKFLKTFQ